MSRTTKKVTLASAVAAAGTFTIPNGEQAQADFVTPQDVTIEVYAREFTCSASFGASEITVTWPAGAPYDLPAGEYYIDFDLVGGDPLSGDASAAANQADSTVMSSITDNSGGTADGTIELVGDTSAANESAAINNNFADLVAKCQALETELNNALSKLKAAGLMEAD